MSIHNHSINFPGDSGDFNDFTFISFEKSNICPRCHLGISATVEANSNLTTTDGVTQFFSVIFSCPVCLQHFVEIYETFKENYKYFGYPIGYVPYQIIDKEVPEKIKNFSPKFFDIYSQALTAEDNKLFEISGMGFRKSIEFLIKDFLIEILSKPKEEITKLPLQQAINLIDNDRIRTLATASLWLGNDETHYSRKHLDRDTQDMKNFIVALYSFINYELIFIEASSLKKK